MAAGTWQLCSGGTARDVSGEAVDCVCRDHQFDGVVLPVQLYFFNRPGAESPLDRKGYVHINDKTYMVT